jgi:asparaginyl-tRNA synthetase
VVGWVDDPDTYPMQPKQHSLEYLREVAHLRPRTNLFGAVTRVRHCLAQAVHRFFHERLLLDQHADHHRLGRRGRRPDVPRVDAGHGQPAARRQGQRRLHKDFFGKETFLTVSGQLNVEAYCLALSKVYTFGPTFRAENSNTSRHLAEFWMIEPEIAFADLADDANLAEDFLKYLFRRAGRARRRHGSSPSASRKTASPAGKFIEAPFERIDYTDAITLLQKAARSSTSRSSGAWTCRPSTSAT